MNKKKIVADLHNHTTASDGDFSPEQLVQTAKDSGVKAVGITDHDTVAGVAAGVAAGKKAGIEVVCGVEVSVRFKRNLFTGTLHVLCYFSMEKMDDAVFVAELNAALSQGRGENLVKARIAEINTHFGPGSSHPILKRGLIFEDISTLSNNASRRHFALALNNIGIVDKDVVNQIIGNSSPAYLPSGVDLTEVVDLFRQPGVLAVLAHPAAGSFPGAGHYKEVLPPIETVAEMLPEFLDAGIKGIEVFYPGHTQAHQKELATWAEKHQLVVTGGSDCHDAKDRPFGVQGLSESEFAVFLDALHGA